MPRARHHHLARAATDQAQLHRSSDYRKHPDKPPFIARRPGRRRPHFNDDRWAVGRASVLSIAGPTAQRTT